MKKCVLVVLFGILLVGCVEREKKIAHYLDNPPPVNCAKADHHLRVLEKEKKSVGERTLSGVTAITPIGLVSGILTGTESTKIEIATGEYNDMLDTRIAQIMRECSR